MGLRIDMVVYGRHVSSEDLKRCRLISYQDRYTSWCLANIGRDESWSVNMARSSSRVSWGSIFTSFS